MSKRSDYLEELESHWRAFADAGFVEVVRYYHPVMDADTGALSWPGSVRVDAVRDGMGVRREEQQTPAGKVIVERLKWDVRRSQVDAMANRGKLVDSDGETWVITDTPDDTGDATDWQFDTVRQ